MVGVMYMAVSRKSSFKIRIAALGALALMIVSVIICLIFYFKAASTSKVIPLPDMMPSDIPPPSSGNPVSMIVLTLFLIALFVVIFIMAMREQKRAEGKTKSGKNW